MAFKRPFNSSDQESPHKKPFSSSTMKFIPFTQSATRLDGTRSEVGEAQNHYRAVEEEKYKAPDIDVMSLINLRELQEKKRWIEKLHITVKDRMNSDRGRGKSLTDNLSHCIQTMKTNPQYIYVELARVNVDDIPRDVRRSYSALPSEGYICECRVQVSQYLPQPELCTAFQLSGSSLHGSSRRLETICPQSTRIKHLTGRDEPRALSLRTGDFNMLDKNLRSTRKSSDRLRCLKGVYLGLGLSVSKAGARDRAIEQTMRVLDNTEVLVLPVQRLWKDRNYPEFVLASGRVGTRENLPPFFSPPEGTKDYERERNREMRMKNNKQRPEKLYQGNPNVHHLGPAVTGIRMENFVIMLKPNENPVCILNTSAQFCKMAVDFYFEKVVRGGENDFVCTVFIEGQPVADAKGPKKTLKHVVADNALKCLSKICHTVVITDSGVDKGSMMSRREIKHKSIVEEKSSKLEENNVGNRMLRMMGWKEGEGLGNKGDSIVEPIKVKNESFNKEGLGSKAINSDNITREEANEIIKNYASNDAIEDLTFSSELSFDERKEIKRMAKRYGLSERTVMENSFGRKRVFLVLSKKIGPEVIIEQLEQEGRWGRYQLVRPEGGDRYMICQFLNNQNLRQSKGFPRELVESRGAEEFGGFRGGESYGNRDMGGSLGNSGGARNNFGGFGINNEGVGRNNSSRFERGDIRDVADFGKGSTAGLKRERDYERVGRGGGFDCRSVGNPSYSNQVNEPSFTIGSGANSGERNSYNEEMCGRGNTETMRNNSGSEFGRNSGVFSRSRDMIEKEEVMRASIVGRMSGHSGGVSRHDGGSNFPNSSAARGQFWQQMNPGGGSGGGGSRSYSVRGRKCSF